MMTPARWSRPTNLIPGRTYVRVTGIEPPLEGVLTAYAMTGAAVAVTASAVYLRKSGEVTEVTIGSRCVALVPGRALEVRDYPEHVHEFTREETLSYPRYRCRVCRIVKADPITQAGGPR